MLKRGIIAGVSGRAWNAVLHLIFTPIYLHLLGVENYGLVGFFTALLSLLSVFDFGLSATLQKELPGQSNLSESWSLSKAVEIFYWAIAALFFLSIFFSSPWISQSWFSKHSLSNFELELSLKWMGAAIALQWPFFLYSGGLLGLQKQGLLSILVIFLFTVRSLGAVVILDVFPSTPVNFFKWQALMGLIQSLVLAAAFWKVFPKIERKCFSWRSFSKLKGFMLGMSGISLTSLFLTQGDKVILSKTVSLSDLGIYSLAIACSTSLYCLIAPIFSAFFPKFSEAIQTNNQNLISLYHKGARMMSGAILPTAMIVAFFPKQLLELWTRNPELAGSAAPILRIGILAVTLHGLINIPYAMQLAHGWTSLKLYQNIFGCLFILPLVYVLSKKIGILAGAIGLLTINGIYLWIGTPLMYRKLLKEEKKVWALQDVLFPFLCSLIIPLLMHILIPFDRLQTFEKWILFPLAILISTVFVFYFNKVLGAKSGLKETFN